MLYTEIVPGCQALIKKGLNIRPSFFRSVSYMKCAGLIQYTFVPECIG
jgi:hypothetical protein